MKRRGFFRAALGVLLAPFAIRQTVAAPVVDAQGGFLVPPEYTKALMGAREKAFRNGWLTVNEMRRMEGKRPLATERLEDTLLKPFAQEVAKRTDEEMTLAEWLTKVRTSG